MWRRFTLPIGVFDAPSYPQKQHVSELGILMSPSLGHLRGREIHYPVEGAFLGGKKHISHAVVSRLTWNLTRIAGVGIYYREKVDILRRRMPIVSKSECDRQPHRPISIRSNADWFRVANTYPRPLPLMRIVDSRLQGFSRFFPAGLGCDVGIFAGLICEVSLPRIAGLGLSQRIASYLNRICGEAGSPSHLAQLARVDDRDNDGRYQEKGVDDNQAYFSNLYSGNKVFGWLCFLAGAALSLKSHYTLLYSGYRGGLHRRLVYGIFGWGLAGVLIWHGASILLGT
jgi:hypothetical protein